jgi:hypothetical protein
VPLSGKIAAEVDGWDLHLLRLPGRSTVAGRPVLQALGVDDRVVIFEREHQADG